MNIQRFIVFLVAIAGAAATFMPWYNVASIGQLTGFATSGWFTFIMFVLILFIILRRNMTKDMSNGNIWLASILGIAASVVVLWRVFDIYFARDTLMELGGRMSGIMGDEIVMRYGVWIVVCAGFCIPLVAFLFKSRKIQKES